MAVGNDGFSEDAIEGGQKGNLLNCRLFGEQEISVLLDDAGGFPVGEDQVGHTEILAKVKERR